MNKEGIGFDCNQENVFAFKSKSINMFVKFLLNELHIICIKRIEGNFFVKKKRVLVTARFHRFVGYVTAWFSYWISCIIIMLAYLVLIVAPSPTHILTCTLELVHICQNLNKEVYM